MKKLLVAAFALVHLHLPVAEADAAKIHRARATCYNLQGRTAAGTYVNRRTAAHNFLSPWTKIRIVGRHAGPRGVRKYIVLDTGADWALGDGHFDLWSASCGGWPNPVIRWKFGWGRA